VGLLFAGIVLALTVHRNSWRVIGWMAARQLHTTIISVTLLWLVATILSISQIADVGLLSFSQKVFSSKETASYLIVAGVLGILFRQALEHLSLFLLFGNTSSKWDLMVLTICSLAFLVYPFAHPATDQAAFLFGMGAGLVVHKSVRLKIARERAAYRRIESFWEISRTVEGWTLGDAEALRDLKEGREFPSKKFKKLRSDLNQLRETQQTKDPACWSKITSLISATAYRLEGEFHQSLAEIHATDASTLMEPIDPHLILLEIVCLNEVNQPKEAEKLIERLRHSELAARCPYTHFLEAERLAYQILTTPGTTTPRPEPLQLATRAYTLRRGILLEKAVNPEATTLNEVWPKFSEASMPRNGSFMINILGLSYLAAGQPDLAQKDFAWCIATDPMMSSPYFNLGEYFLFRRALRGKPLREIDYNGARAAYYAAHLVEGVEASRIHGMVQKRLALVDELQRAGEQKASSAASAESGTSKSGEAREPPAGDGGPTISAVPSS
jgi:hypothetical protein